MPKRAVLFIFFMTIAGYLAGYVVGRFGYTLAGVNPNQSYGTLTYVGDRLQHMDDDLTDFAYMLYRLRDDVKACVDKPCKCKDLCSCCDKCTKDGCKCTAKKRCWDGCPCGEKKCDCCKKCKDKCKCTPDKKCHDGCKCDKKEVGCCIFRSVRQSGLIPPAQFKTTMVHDGDALIEWEANGQTYKKTIPAKEWMELCRKQDAR